MYKRFLPLKNHLERTISRKIILKIARDYHRRGDVEFSYSNPYIYTQFADKGHLKALANTLLRLGITIPSENG